MAKDDEHPVELARLVRWIEGRTRGCTALDRLSLAVKVAAALQGTSDELVGHFVGEARAAGASWAQIGGHLGVSKQAAQQRHVGRRHRIRARRERRPGASQAFEQFTPPAREAMGLAQSEALGLGHNYLGTEHILLGIVSEPVGTGGSCSRAAGLSADRLREVILQDIGRGPEAAEGAIPFTPRAKRLLERAVRDADGAGAPEVGTGRLLLAVVGDRRGMAARFALRAGVDLDALRDETLRAIAVGDV